MKNTIFILALIVSIPFFMESCCRKPKVLDPVNDCGCPDTTFVCDNDSLQCHCPEGEIRFANSCFDSLNRYMGVMENCNTCFDTILVGIRTEEPQKGISLSNMDGTYIRYSGGVDYYYQGTFGDSIHTGGVILNCNINGTICDAEISGRYSVDKSSLRLWFRFYPLHPLNFHQTVQTCSTTLNLR